jgi:F-type H+-transporting ATPase subunit gamma
MINSLNSEVDNMQLLPLKKTDFKLDIPAAALAGTYQEEFHMIPSEKDVFERIVPNYVTGIIYGALIESYSSEQNARMQAMQSATDSAEKMMHDLSIQYNRVRQSAITQEITEVVGGARALQRNKSKMAEEEIE